MNGSSSGIGLSIPTFPEWNLRVGGKCLIAIYLPKTAFDTHDEPLWQSPPQEAGFFSPHSAQHWFLLCVCFVSAFFAQTVHFEGSTNPRRAPQCCHCRETHRASHTVMPSKRVQDADSFEEALLKQKGFPHVRCAWQIPSFPPLQTELTDKFLLICTSQAIYVTQIN